MFQFRRFPAYAYFIQRTLTEYCSAGLPHSEISGSKPMCGSPKLIAACHVLRRLLMPRHSPCALSSLTSPAQSPFRSGQPFGYPELHSLAPPPPRKPASLGSARRKVHHLVGSHELCRHYRSSFRLLLLPFTRTAFAILLNPQHLLSCPLLLALTYCTSHCSVFKVQLLASFKVRLKCSDACPNTSI